VTTPYGLPNIGAMPGTVETVARPKTPRSTTSCVVVGGGLLGLSAAWALARRGTAVMVLEAGDEVGHERSGSKGDARIFRLGYPERPYVEMALQARDLWSALETRCGRTLLHVTGQVAFGAEVESISAALEAAGAPFERLSTREVAAKLPGIDIDGPALFEPDSGVLAAGECLRALREDAAFEVRTGVRVTSLHDGEGEVAVRTAAGDEFRASVVVNCAGPGAFSLLATGARPARLVASEPSLPQVAYFRWVDRRDEDRGLPVFIEWGPDMIYGLPVPPSRAVGAGTYKVSHHTAGTPLDAFDPSNGEPLAGDDPALVALLTSAVARLLPVLDPEPVATERCVYDNTNDGDFVIDRIGRVVVGCGTSGHGFKFGPLLGEMMADLALGAGTQPRAGSPNPLHLRRFALDRAGPTAGERR
jgi:sarcosine oxidase